MITESRQEISCSSRTLLGPATLPLMGLPIELWIQLVQSSGYDGLQWSPLKKTSLPEIQISSGLLSNRAKVGIKTLEQSFRGERTFNESLRHPNKAIALAAWMLFPYRSDSISQLVRLQSLVGEIPTTVYPAQDAIEVPLQNKLSNKNIQLAPDVVESWRVNSLEELIDQYYQRGFGITFDIFHYFRLREIFKLPPTQQALKLILPLTKEIHISAARVDVSPNDQDTRDAYLDLLRGTQNSEAVRTFAQVINMGYKGPITTEVVPQVIGTNPLKVFKAHQLFVKNINSWIDRV